MMARLGSSAWDEEATFLVVCWHAVLAVPDESHATSPPPPHDLAEMSANSHPEQCMTC